MRLTPVARNDIAVGVEGAGSMQQFDRLMLAATAQEPLGEAEQERDTLGPSFVESFGQGQGKFDLARLPVSLDQDEREQRQGWLLSQRRVDLFARRGKVTCTQGDDCVASRLHPGRRLRT